MGIMFCSKWILTKHATWKFNRNVAKRFPMLLKKGFFSSRERLNVTFIRLALEMPAMSSKLELSNSAIRLNFCKEIFQ